MEMCGADVRRHHFNGRGHAFGKVRVPCVEADSDILEVAYLNKLDEFLGGAEFVGDVLDQQANSEGFCESPEMLDGGHGSVELLFVETLASGSDVLDEETERNGLGDFD